MITTRDDSIRIEDRTATGDGYRIVEGSLTLGAAPGRRLAEAAVVAIRRARSEMPDRPRSSDVLDRACELLTEATRDWPAEERGETPEGCLC